MELSFFADGTRANCFCSGSTELGLQAEDGAKFLGETSCRRWSERWARWNRERFAEPTDLAAFACIVERATRETGARSEMRSHLIYNSLPIRPPSHRGRERQTKPLDIQSLPNTRSTSERAVP
jgi:hypothetical protein